jgi:hypothetical protein
MKSRFIFAISLFSIWFSSSVEASRVLRAFGPEIDALCHIQTTQPQTNMTREDLERKRNTGCVKSTVAHMGFKTEEFFKTPLLAVVTLPGQLFSPANRASLKGISSVLAPGADQELLRQITIASHLMSTSRSRGRTLTMAKYIERDLVGRSDFKVLFLREPTMLCDASMRTLAMMKEDRVPSFAFFAEANPEMAALLGVLNQLATTPTDFLLPSISFYRSGELVKQLTYGQSMPVRPETDLFLGYCLNMFRRLNLIPEELPKLVNHFSKKSEINTEGKLLAEEKYTHTEFSSKFLSGIILPHSEKGKPFWRLKFRLADGSHSDKFHPRIPIISSVVGEKS